MADRPKPAVADGAQPAAKTDKPDDGRRPMIIRIEGLPGYNPIYAAFMQPFYEAAVRMNLGVPRGAQARPFVSHPVA